MRIIPCCHALILAPLLIVKRVAALKDHAVDTARPAQHLAAAVGDLPVVHKGLWLRFVAPIIVFVANRKGEPRRHVDKDIPEIIGAAGLEHQYTVARVGAQAVGQHTARRAAANDNGVVVDWLVSWLAGSLVGWLGHGVNFPLIRVTYCSVVSGQSSYTIPSSWYSKLEDCMRGNALCQASILFGIISVLWEMIAFQHFSKLRFIGKPVILLFSQLQRAVSKPLSGERCD